MKLRVLIVANDHGCGVEQALRSALTQKTDFDYDIFVIDGGSREGMREAVAALLDHYPDRARFVLHATGPEIHQNVLEGFARCHSQYVALLDGSDYWVTPYKLQRQVEFLDRHAACAVSFHNVLRVHDDGRPESLAWSEAGSDMLGVEDLLVANVVPRSSAVYRTSALHEFPQWWLRLADWDWALNLLYAQCGRVAYLADTMAVARGAAGGSWTDGATSDRMHAAVELLERFAVHFDGKYDAAIRASIARWQIRIKPELVRQSFDPLADVATTLSA